MAEGEYSRRFVTERPRFGRHHLPHHQMGGSTYFVTFRSARGVLPDQALAALRDHLSEGHGGLFDLAFGVIMPDHVHLLLRPRPHSPGLWHDLGAIMKSIKGGSARKINRILGTERAVWQKESFDRIVPDDAEFEQKWDYMVNNPRKAGLVEDSEDDRFFIRPVDEGNSSRESGTVL